MTDREEIVQLTIAYCWAIDTGDWHALNNIFLADATADFARGGQRGIEEIVHRVSSALAPLDDSQHMVSNHQISIDGDTAEGRCYLQAQHIRHAAPGGSLYTVGGRYEDSYLRSDAGWRISHRRLVPMWAEGNRAVFERSSDVAKDASNR